MSSSAIKQLSDQQTSGLLKAYHEDDYPGFCRKVRECAKAGIQLTTIEVFLREQNCKVHLIARDHKKSAVRLFPCRSPDGTEQPYFLYIAMHPEARKEFKDEKENLKNLANTGFVLKMEK